MSWRGSPCWRDTSTNGPSNESVLASFSNDIHLWAILASGGPELNLGLNSAASRSRHWAYNLLVRTKTSFQTSTISHCVYVHSAILLYRIHVGSFQQGSPRLTVVAILQRSSDTPVSLSPLCVVFPFQLNRPRKPPIPLPRSFILAPAHCQPPATLVGCCSWVKLPPLSTICS